MLKRPHLNTFSRRGSKLISGLKQYRWMYLLFLPVVIVFFLFSYMPMYGVLLAFKDYNIRQGIMGSKWVGFDHFKRLLTTPVFWDVLTNTLEISVKRIIFGFPAPIIFALLLNEVTSRKFKRVVQTISYMPHFLSWVIIAGFITEILSPSRGIVNYFLMMLGKEPIYFLTQPSMFQWILVVSGIWQSVGWGAITYLAAITGVDAQLYEAAVVDGAGRWRCVWNITLPSIRPIVSIVFLLSLAGILNGGFDQVFNLYNSQVFSTGDIIDTYVYRLGMERMDYSFSTAVNLFKNLVGLILIVSSNAIVRRFGEGENALW